MRADTVISLVLAEPPTIKLWWLHARSEDR